MVDDESLLIDSLNGFPGPYLKDFEAHLKAEGVYKVLSSLGSDVCYPQVYYAITFDGKTVYTFNGRMKAVSIKPRDEFADSKDYYEALYSVDWNMRLSEVPSEVENSKSNNRMIAIEKMIDFFEQNPVHKN
jgi:inosine/xanthosine triphosphate pyrophosphatase family protein